MKLAGALPTCLLSLLVPTAALGAAGDLDTTFGSPVVTPIGTAWDYGLAVKIDGSGRIVVAGNSQNPTFDFAVARYNANGTLDPTFNGTGKVVTPIGAGTDGGDAVAIDGSGRIVVAGSSVNGINRDFAVARYDANGTLDPTFNGTGKVTTDVGGARDDGNAVAIDSSGRIVVAGSSVN